MIAQSITATRPLDRLSFSLDQIGSSISTSNDSSVSREDIVFRVASETELGQIIELLADDSLGVNRELAGPEVAPEYRTAFEEIDADPNNEIIVAAKGNRLIGCMQLTYTANLTHRASRRATIEGVRIAADFRSKGLGSAMLDWALDRCRRKGCGLVQLTTDLQREQAMAFYEKHGFRHSHAGMKLWIKETETD